MNQTDKNLHDHRHMFCLQVIEKERDLWKDCVAKGNSEMFPFSQEIQSEKAIRKSWVSLKTTWMNCRTKIERVSLPFNTSAGPDDRPVQGNLCSSSEIDFVRRGRILWGKGWLWSPDEKNWSAPRHTLGFSENNQRFSAVFNFLHMKSFLLSNKHCEPGQILTYFTWKWNPREILSTSTKNGVFIQLKASFILKWKFYY